MADDYRAAFLRLLNNQPTKGSEGEAKIRDRGFVVLVPGKKSLKPLQSLCFEQHYNTCYTVRYRISAGSVFGTLFIALVRDIVRTSGDREPQGLFQPELKELDTKELAIARKEFENLVPEELLDGRAGELSPDTIVESLLLVERMTSSAIGKRFVLFCEVEAETGDIQEWERAGSTFLQSLPERVGLVFSGAPDGFELGPERDKETPDTGEPSGVESAT